MTHTPGIIGILHFSSRTYIALAVLDAFLFARCMCVCYYDGRKRSVKNTSNRALTEIQGHQDFAWSDPALPDQIRDGYDALTALLMDVLGLCYICGKRPDEGELTEQNRMMLCSDCILPFM